MKKHFAISCLVASIDKNNQNSMNELKIIINY
jgi:hypothetical protein